MKILLTAFEPFGGRQLNSSLRVLESVDAAKFPAVCLKKAVLPVQYKAAANNLLDLFDDYSPDATICLGEAGGRSQVSLERVAINYADYRISDNYGNQVRDEVLMPDATAAYFSTLPLKKAELRIREAGIPVEISLSAGSFLCNEVFFHLMHKISHHDYKQLGGFIHLPYLPEEAAYAGVAAPSMGVELLTEAVSIMIAECVSLLSEKI